MKQDEKNHLPRHADFAQNSDMLFALFPLAFMAVYLYGLRPAAMLVLAFFTASVCDFLVAKLRGQRYDASENSSLVFAALFTLMLPATASYAIVVTGVVVAVLVGKHAFGGAGSYPFHPAALGYAVVTVSWADQIFRSPTPFTHVGLWDTSTATLEDASSHILRTGGVPNIPSLDLTLGSYAGPMGATFVLVILAVALYLLLRRRISLELPLAFLATSALISVLFPRVATAGAFELMKYELLSGALLYAAVFMLCEPTTAPKNRLARVAYGVLAGFLTMMFRYYGAYELGVCFALLLANAFSGYLDRVCSKAAFQRRSKSL